MLGHALLVAPPFDRKRYDVYLPIGKWVNYFTGEVLDGGQYVTVEPKLGELPVFQRENTCVLQSTEAGTEDGYFEHLKANIFCTGEMQETLYDYNAAGEIRTWTLRTTAGDTENAPMRQIGTSGALRIETDAPVQEAVVIGDAK